MAKIWRNDEESGMRLFEIAEKPPVNWDAKSEKQQIALVKRSPQSMQKITNPSEAVQLAAVNANIFAIEFIKNPSEVVQLAAVTRYGRALRFISDQSEAVKSAAVNQDMYAFVYVNNPSDEMIKLALTSRYFIDSPSLYEYITKKLFANNTILMKKWLRYGETMRNQ
jgi:hypothetical protein